MFLSASIASALAACLLHLDSTLPLRPFTDSVTERTGFQDLAGKVVIPATFHPTFTSEQMLVKVVPATDSSGTFYLRRDGSRFGFDSVMIDDDNMPPCLREGRLRFWDPRTKRQGYFDDRGTLVAPALHRWTLDFHGGYARVLTEGTQVCYDGKPRDPAKPCEYWRWEGEWDLIDTQGKVVVKDFGIPRKFAPDWLSARIVERETDTARRTWATNDGHILSMEGIEGSFRKWSDTELARFATVGPGPADLFATLAVDPRAGWKAGRGATKEDGDSLWKVARIEEFLNANHAALRNLFRSARGAAQRRIGLSASSMPFEERIAAEDPCRQYDPQANPVVELSWKAKMRVRTVRFVRWDGTWQILELE